MNYFQVEVGIIEFLRAREGSKCCNSLVSNFNLCTLNTSYCPIKQLSFTYSLFLLSVPFYNQDTLSVKITTHTLKRRNQGISISR